MSDRALVPHRRQRNAGQALLEFVMFLVTMLVLTLGVLEFGRLFSLRQILTSLSREGSNLASRGTTLPDTAAAIVASAQPLNIDSDGCVILSTISRDGNGTTKITSQTVRGGKSFKSRLVAKGNSSVVDFPSAVLPPAGQTIVMTEVFYVFKPATIVGKLIGRALPTALYDAAYF